MEHQYDESVTGDGWSYSKFVRRNPAGARTLESLLQYAGFFTPASIADRDLAIESGYAVASLAALTHDRILLHDRQGDDAALGVADQRGAAERNTTGAKTRGRTSMAVLTERMRIALAMIAHVQIVVEKMVGQHGGEQRRRQAIMYLEMLKAVSRLVLLACTREMVIGGGAYVPGKRRLPQRHVLNKPAPWGGIDLGEVRSDPQSQPVTDRPFSAPHLPQVYTGRRSGVRLVVPPRASVVWSGRGRSNRVGLGRSATPCDGSCSQRRFGGTCSTCRGSGEGSIGVNGVSRESATVVADGEAEADVTCSGGDAQQWQALRPGDNRHYDSGFSQSWLMAGEIVHILRPLVYSYSCGSSGERSWRPWVASLGMDAVAYACTARAGGGKMALLLPIGSGRDSSGVPVLPFLTKEQVAELQRRKVLWFLYLMRSPAFELLAEPVTRGAAGMFEGLPLLGGLAGYALNMLLYVQRHHFYTSAS